MPQQGVKRGFEATLSMLGFSALSDVAVRLVGRVTPAARQPKWSPREPRTCASSWARWRHATSSIPTVRAELSHCLFGQAAACEAAMAQLQGAGAQVEVAGALPGQTDRVLALTGAQQQVNDAIQTVVSKLEVRTPLAAMARDPVTWGGSMARVNRV